MRVPLSKAKAEAESHSTAQAASAHRDKELKPDAVLTTADVQIGGEKETRRASLGGMTLRGGLRIQSRSRRREIERTLLSGDERNGDESLSGIF